MKYIGFKNLDLNEIMWDLKKGDGREQDPMVMQTYKPLDYKVGDRYILAKCNNNEFLFYKLLLDPASKLSQSDLTEFIIPPLGIICDEASESIFVVTDNVYAQPGQSFLIAEVGAYELLPSDNETKQLEKLKSGVLNLNNNKGFMIHSYEVLDHEGCTVSRGTSKKGRKDKITPEVFSVALLYPEEIVKQHRDFCIESLVYFKQQLVALAIALEEITEIVFPVLKVMFLINFSNKSYSLKLHRQKRAGILHNRSLWKKEYLPQLTTLISDLDVIAEKM